MVRVRDGDIGRTKYCDTALHSHTARQGNLRPLGESDTHKQPQDSNEIFHLVHHQDAVSTSQCVCGLVEVHRYRRPILVYKTHSRRRIKWKCEPGPRIFECVRSSNQQKIKTLSARRVRPKSQSNIRTMQPPISKHITSAQNSRRSEEHTSELQ